MNTNLALAEAYRHERRGAGPHGREPGFPRSMGSTDMGNVSIIVPAIHPSLAIAR